MTTEKEMVGMYDRNRKTVTVVANTILVAGMTPESKTMVNDDFVIALSRSTLYLRSPFEMDFHHTKEAFT